MLSAEVSWRVEPGVNRAYVWLTDGTVIGHRDLDTGLDHLHERDRHELLDVYLKTLSDWSATYGLYAPRIGPAPEPHAGPAGRGLVGWWRRRRYERAQAVQSAAWREWHLDRPTWRIPTDPPNGGWRDLVRNEAGASLWTQAAATSPSGWWDRAGYSESRAWRVGAMGEESVGAELWRLARASGGAWRYVHSVPVGSRGSDIDHVVVGPGGVFTLNTKAHVGANIWVAGNTFMVNGHRQRYIHNSRHEAERAARLLAKATDLDVPIRGLIVVVDPRDITVRQNAEGVHVTTRRRLASWLAGQPQTLSPGQTDRLFEAIRRTSTWTLAGAPRA